MANLNGKNLQFLSGTQAGVNNLIATPAGTIEGAFYLTSDTNRLYIGTVAGPVPVNQGVITVANVATLPAAAEPGQFYFATAENVLCVWSKGNFIQINADTKLKDFSTSVSDKTDKKVTITSTVSDTSTASDTDGATKADSFALVEGAGITLTVNEKEITISSSGTGGVTLTLLTGQVKDNKKAATIKQHSIVTAADGTTTTSDEEITLIGGANIAAVTAGEKSITIDASVQEVTEHTFANGDTGFTFTTKQTSGTDVTSSVLDPIVTIGAEGNTKDVHFQKGAAALDVYTITQTDKKITDEIDKALKVADAMVFKGTIGTGGTVASPDAITEARNGDTYKAKSNFTYNGETVKVGDLLIAQGTEDEATGLLKTGFSFEIVPSGNEYETKVTKVTHGIELTDGALTPTILGGIKLAEGKQVTLTDDTAEDGDRVVTVAHADIATETPAAEDSSAYGAVTDYQKTKTITVVKSLEVDNGHVTKIVTGEEEIVNSIPTLTGATQTAEAKTAGKDIQVTTTVTDSNNIGVDAVFNFKSDTITLNADGASLTMNMVWGSF